MKSVKTERSRFILVMTYASERQLTQVIIDHASSVRAFAYILHDKDEAEPHYHLILRLHQAWTPSAIEKWFKGLTDKKNEPINTFAEKANDLTALELYLTHDDFESRQKGKHQYPKSAIKDHGLWDIVPKNDSKDHTYDIICDVMNGMTERQLIIRHGKEYLYHRYQYKEIVDAIITEEGYGLSHSACRNRQGRKLTEIKGLDDWI